MRLSRLRRCAVALVALLAVAACQDQREPLAPDVNAQLGKSGPPDHAAPEARIRTLISQLFSQPEKAEAQRTMAQVKRWTERGGLEEAESQALSIIGLLLSSDLNDLPDGTPAADAASTLTEVLCDFVGLAGCLLPAAVLESEDVAVEPIDENGGVVVTESGEAAIEVPPGAVDEEVLFVAGRLDVADASDCLPTARPQREGCYLFETIPELADGFNVDVTVGVCLDATGLTEEEEEWYHLYAHDDGDPNVRLLPSAPPPAALDCSGFVASAPSTNPLVRWASAGWSAVRSVVGPRPLRATNLGRGGSIGAFSTVGWAQNSLLIYGPSMTPVFEDPILNSDGSVFIPVRTSTEETIAAAAGHNVVVVDGPTWSGTPATGPGGFGDYDVLVIGSGSSPDLSFAEASTGTWGPVVAGRAVVHTVHAPFHTCDFGTPSCAAADPAIWDNPEGLTLVEQALAWISRTRGTGFYAGLGIIEGLVPAAPLPVLGPLGAFAGEQTVVTGPLGDQVEMVVPGHPVVTGISGASLSDWFASYHQLLTAWPADFQVLTEGYQTGEFVQAEDEDGNPIFDENGDPVLVAVPLETPFRLPIVVVRDPAAP